MKLRITALFLAMALLCALLPTVGAATISSSDKCDGGKTCPSYQFTDVKYGNWYHEAVDYVVTNNLFNGVTKKEFKPDLAMSRAMLVTVLWRLEGSPNRYGNPFTDVMDGIWYDDAVSWASEHSIVFGVTKDKFDPDAKLTREQLTAILYRYCKYKGMDVSTDVSFYGYPDVADVDAWAYDSYLWAIGAGLIAGNQINGKTMLDPKGNATRAQVATIFMRFVENLK